MSGPRDPAVRAQLAAAASLYSDAGAIDFVHEVVRETWAANRERWSPSVHFDDTNTLGYQTSRNVNNRIFRTLDAANVSPSVRVETETGVVMLGLDGFRLRVVKAPIESGLSPDFENDFDWSTSATRTSAARRNSNNYYPIAADEWVLDLGSDPRPPGRRSVEMCRDLFLVWAAELTSDRTVGWIGLPRIGDSPWMGAVELWADADDEAAEPTDPNGDRTDEDEEEDDD